MTSQLPAIFEQTPEAVVPAQTIAEFPVSTFLENTAVDAAGTLFVTSGESEAGYPTKN